MRIWASLGFGTALALATIAGPALTGAQIASAQSAADKATARQLATDGIKLYRAGKHAEALDKLQRAQNLYDAPPHLLYIARSQVALGKVVEGAETYRTLSRSNLPAGSPAAFKQAQDEGNAELAELEPKIPAVRITVKPEGTSNLDVRIDGEQVTAAIVGVDRPINPGQHTIRVSAPGFDPAQQTVDVKLGEKKPVAIDLQAAGGTAPVVGPAPGPGPAPVQPGYQPAPAPGPEPGPPPPTTPSEGPKIGFMLGARIGGAFTFGEVFENPLTNETLKMNDSFGPGGGLELQGGVRFAKYFTAKLLFGGYGFKPEKDAEPQNGTEADNTTSAFSAGIGAQIGSPRGQFGGFGEVGYLFVHEYTITNKLTDLDCESTTSLRGPAWFLGGGLSVPLSPSWALTPFASFQVGQFDEAELDSDCPGVPNGKNNIESDSQKTHGMVLLGVGFEFLFGSDKPGQ